MPQTFKDAFCAHFQCAPEDFERQVLARSIHPRAKVLWKFFDVTGGPAVRAAHKFVALIGQTQTHDDLIDAIREYKEDIKPYSGFAAHVLKVRVSTERIKELDKLIRGSNASSA